MNAQLDGLYKRAALEGFVDLGFSSREARDGEKVVWSSGAISFKYRSRGGATYWDQDELGRFVVSNTRFWFETKARPKPRLLSDVEGVEVQYQTRLPILVLGVRNLVNPLGFGIDPTQVEVTIEGQTRQIGFDVHDVAAMMKRLVL